jgi:hypothetical protein
MEIPVEPMILPFLAVCFACVCVVCGWRVVKLVVWDCGFNTLPIPRFVRRLLWFCGISCSTCPYEVVRDCGDHDTFTLNCEPIGEHTPDSGETFIL